MTERVARLRQASLDTKPWLSIERAALLTEFYRQAVALPEPMLRAHAFYYIMDRKTIYIGPEELIVGERGEAPKGAPTYPELCCHTIQDFDILDSRQKISYAVDARPAARSRTRSFRSGRAAACATASSAKWSPPGRTATRPASTPSSWSSARPATPRWATSSTARGCWTSKRISRPLAQLDFVRDREAWDKQQELKAMAVAADAVIRFAERHAEKAREMAAGEADPRRKAELERIAEVCSHVPAHAPRDFWEALQYYWFVHLGVITELNTWDSFCPGRLDQHSVALLPERPGRWDAHPRARPGTARMLLGEVQQPARAAQGGRDRGRERDLYGLRQHQ
jgi:hypothetical protein